MLPGCGLPPADDLAPASAIAGTPGVAGSPGVTGSAPVPPTSDQEDPAGAGVERRVAALVNDERRAAGLPPLQVDQGLESGCRDWSATMAARWRLGHDPGLTVPPGSSVTGENVAFRPSGGDAAGGLVAQWLDSPEHRDNLLDPHYVRTGVGVVQAGGRTWACQRFSG
jgi:uncharacterized protein YkwD